MVKNFVGCMVNRTRCIVEWEGDMSDVVGVDIGVSLPGNKLSMVHRHVAKRNFCTLFNLPRAACTMVAVARYAIDGKLQTEQFDIMQGIMTIPTDRFSVMARVDLRIPAGTSYRSSGKYVKFIDDFEISAGEEVDTDLGFYGESYGSFVYFDDNIRISRYSLGLVKQLKSPEGILGKEDSKKIRCDLFKKGERPKMLMGYSESGEKWGRN